MANKPNSGETSQLVYKVRLPKNHNKKFSLLKFSTNVDFTKKEAGPVKIERENNFKTFKLSNDIETMPTYGAGSEFGRERKEEARRKMMGYRTNKYNPDNQPWLLNIGESKNIKKYKGKKATNNASYYIFCQAAEGYFDAFPLDDWYNFTPLIKYNHLTSEEAEEEFIRRDKVMNHFSIMVNKKICKDKDVDEEDEKEAKTSKKVAKKANKGSFKLTEMDEWSDGDDGAMGMGGGDSDEEKPPKDEEDDASSKKKKTREGAKKKQKKELDDSAAEESDDLNEGDELDYITDTDSEDEDMYSEKNKSEKYDMKGVAEEEGMRKILDSDEEEEEEKKENGEENTEQTEEAKTKKEGVESESESSGDSGSDSDIDKEPLPSALLMQQKKKKESNENTPSSSRSATPTNDKDKKKRKTEETEDSASKRSRTNTPTPPLPSQFTANDGVTEEAVRRYLMRKPMTVKDLMIKLHKNSGIPKDQVANTVGSILKKINPEKVKTGDKLYFHLKKN